VRLGAPIARSLEHLVMRLLSKDPMDRPVSAMALTDELDRCVREVGPWTQADAREWWEFRGKVVLRQSAQATAGVLPGTTRRYDAGDPTPKPPRS
jgi:hypothetical protein